VLAENAIRPFVIGLKAYLFADTPKGATATETHHTPTESVKTNNVDLFKHMLHLCKFIAKAQTVEDIEALLPLNVKDQLTR